MCDCVLCMGNKISETGRIWPGISEQAIPGLQLQFMAL